MRKLLRQEEILKLQDLQRWIQKQNGLRVQYDHSEFTILQSKSQTQKDLLNKAFFLFKGKLCLGIYTSQEPGRLICLVQPFWFRFKIGDPTCFTNVSDSIFEDKLENRSTYIFAIYRYASDKIYRMVLSDKKIKESLILRYLKNEIGEVKVDRKYSFHPEVRFLEKKRYLSQKQILAITKAGLFSTMIIKGGAGTGKSLTGCLIAIEFALVGRKVIMGAVTDTGAKALAIHLISELPLYIDEEKFLDIMGKIKGLRSFKDFILPEEGKKEQIAFMDLQLKQLIRENEERNQRKMKFLFFNSLITEEEYFCLHPTLRSYCFNTRIIVNFLKVTNYEWSILDILETINNIAEKIYVDQVAKNLYLQAVQVTVSEATIVVTNSSKAADLNRYQPEGKRFKPHLAIFDEAAQSTLADAYCILSLDIKRLILIGDLNQLTSEVRGPYQQLKKSILALMLQRERNIVEFDEQFRMHPEIAKLVAYITYNRKLKNGFKEWKQIRELKGIFENPVFMVTHNHPEALPEGNHNFGFYNIWEIMMIKVYIDRFPPQMMHQIGIITTYRAQAEVMKKVFAEEITLGLVVSTVDGYQGGEKDYLFASIVRCNDRGLVDSAQSKNRLTVLLSRARKGLAIFGSAETLLQGSYDNPWRQVIYYLWLSKAIYQFTPELEKLAKDNYGNRRDCEVYSQMEVEVDRTFDTETYEMNEDVESISTISVEEVDYEIEEQPFIKSNYN